MRVTGSALRCLQASRDGLQRSRAINSRPVPVGLNRTRAPWPGGHQRSCQVRSLRREGVPSAPFRFVRYAAGRCGSRSRRARTTGWRNMCTSARSAARPRFRATSEADRGRVKGLVSRALWTRQRTCVACDMGSSWPALGYGLRPSRGQGLSAQVGFIRLGQFFVATRASPSCDGIHVLGRRASARRGCHPNSAVAEFGHINICEPGPTGSLTSAGMTRWEWNPH
jgi:hypothetical protein